MPAALPFLGRAAELEAIEEFVARTLDAGGTSGSRVVCGLLLDGCTTATVQSPACPPPAAPSQVIPYQ